MRKLKTFNHLIFKAHRHLPNGGQATMKFKNRYGISVVNGLSAYCDKDTFEIAVLYEGSITYNTEITSDVLGYQTPENITEIMKKIQLLEL